MLRTTFFAKGTEIAGEIDEKIAFKRSEELIVIEQTRSKKADFLDVCRLTFFRVLLFMFMLVKRWRRYSFHAQSSTALSVQKQDRFQCLHGTGRIRNRSGLKLDLFFLVLQFVRLTILEFVRFRGFRVNARPNRTNW